MSDQDEYFVAKMSGIGMFFISIVSVTLLSGCTRSTENLHVQANQVCASSDPEIQVQLSCLWDLYLIDKVIDLKQYRLGERLLLAGKSKLSPWETQRYQQLLVVLDDEQAKVDRDMALDAFRSPSPASLAPTAWSNQRNDWMEWYKKNWPWMDEPVPF
jgi:hypothetical protein